MAMELHHVLTGEAAWRTHQQQKHLIQTLLTCGIEHMAVNNPVGAPLLGTRTMHHGPTGRFRRRTGETDHSDSPLAWGNRRCDSGNGVGGGQGGGQLVGNDRNTIPRILLYVRSATVLRSCAGCG